MEQNTCHNHNAHATEPYYDVLQVYLIHVTLKLMKYQQPSNTMVYCFFFTPHKLLNFDGESLSMYSYVSRNWKCLILNHHAFDHLKSSPKDLLSYIQKYSSSTINYFSFTNSNLR